MRLRRLTTACLACSMLLAGGCERVLYRYVNRGLAPPETTVVFAPELGLSMDVFRAEGTAAGAGAIGKARTRATTPGAPVVVFFYGGAWQHGERAQYRFVARQLARHGVLVVVPDYRTYPRSTFPGFIEDGARAVEAVRAGAPGWGGDPRRIFLAGHSAGAQIAALLATDPRYLRRQGMAVSDIAGVIGLSGPYDFVIGGKLRPVFGPPARWPDAQPVNFVDGDEPPFLLIHGTGDRRVESADSVELAQRLQAHGVDAGLLLLPGAGHGAPLADLYRPNRSPRVLAAILGFIDAGDAGAASRAEAPHAPVRRDGGNAP